MTSPKFNAGDTILWDRKKWRVENVDSHNKLYELSLVNQQDVSTLNGTRGYMDISKIDENATLVTPQNGGLKRSLKNRRSLNRRRNYRRRVKTIRRK